MTAIVFDLPNQKPATLYYLRFKWRGMLRKYRGQYGYTAELMRAAARLALREINAELAARGMLRERQFVSG